MAKPKLGKYKDPIFPGAEIELEAGTLVRYATKGPFKDICRHFEVIYEGRKNIQTTRTEADGFPSFAVGKGPSAQDVDFEAILVMVDPKTKKKRKQRWHILVIGAD